MSRKKKKKEKLIREGKILSQRKKKKVLLRAKEEREAPGKRNQSSIRKGVKKTSVPPRRGKKQSERYQPLVKASLKRICLYNEEGNRPYGMTLFVEKKG